MEPLQFLIKLDNYKILKNGSLQSTIPQSYKKKSNNRNQKLRFLILPSRCEDIDHVNCLDGQCKFINVGLLVHEAGRVG